MQKLLESNVIYLNSKLLQKVECFQIYKMYSRKAPKIWKALFAEWCWEVTGACLLYCLFGARLPVLPAKRGLGLSQRSQRLSRSSSSPLHTPAIRQAAKQTDEVNREMLPRVFWDVTATDATLTPRTWHSVTTLLCLHNQLHFDLFWKGRWGGDIVHMITHKIMFVSSNTGATV